MKSSVHITLKNRHYADIFLLHSLSLLAENNRNALPCLKEPWNSLKGKELLGNFFFDKKKLGLLCKDINLQKWQQGRIKFFEISEPTNKLAVSPRIRGFWCSYLLGSTCYTQFNNVTSNNTPLKKNFVISKKYSLKNSFYFDNLVMLQKNLHSSDKTIGYELILFDMLYFTRNSNKKLLFDWIKNYFAARIETRSLLDPFFEIKKLNNVQLNYMGFLYPFTVLYSARVAPPYFIMWFTTTWSALAEFSGYYGNNVQAYVPLIPLYVSRNFSGSLQKQSSINFWLIVIQLDAYGLLLSLLYNLRRNNPKSPVQNYKQKKTFTARLKPVWRSFRATRAEKLELQYTTPQKWTFSAFFLSTLSLTTRIYWLVRRVNFIFSLNGVCTPLSQLNSVYAVRGLKLFRDSLILKSKMFSSVRSMSVTAPTNYVKYFNYNNTYKPYLLSALLLRTFVQTKLSSKSLLACGIVEMSKLLVSRYIALMFQKKPNVSNTIRGFFSFLFTFQGWLNRWVFLEFLRLSRFAICSLNLFFLNFWSWYNFFPQTTTLRFFILIFFFVSFTYKNCCWAFVGFFILLCGVLLLYLLITGELISNPIAVWFSLRKVPSFFLYKKAVTGKAKSIPYSLIIYAIRKSLYGVGFAVAITLGCCLSRFYIISYSIFWKKILYLRVKVHQMRFLFRHPSGRLLNYSANWRQHKDFHGLILIELLCVRLPLAVRKKFAMDFKYTLTVFKIYSIRNKIWLMLEFFQLQSANYFWWVRRTRSIQPKLQFQEILVNYTFNLMSVGFNAHSWALLFASYIEALYKRRFLTVGDIFKLIKFMFPSKKLRLPFITIYVDVLSSDYLITARETKKTPHVYVIYRRPSGSFLTKNFFKFLLILLMLVFVVVTMLLIW